MAFGLLHMRGINGWAGWQWMFLVEGLITLCIGLASFFMMPASAVQTKTWFRPNGWFTDREVSIVVNRVLRDDPSKGDMHNREAITPKRLWETLKDYDLWPLYAIGLVAYIPQTPVNYYLTLTLRRLGFSAFNTNLLVIPSVSYPFRVPWGMPNADKTGKHSLSSTSSLSSSSPGSPTFSRSEPLSPCSNPSGHSPASWRSGSGPV